MKTSLRDQATWLFDLAHGNLEQDEIVKGFLRFYALSGLSTEHVKQHLIFYTAYGNLHAEEAMKRLQEALESFVKTR